MGGFSMFFSFYPYLNDDPIWLNYLYHIFFKDRLKPLGSSLVFNMKSQSQWQLSWTFFHYPPTGKTRVVRICRIKHQPCHVIYTDKRPVPLQHYLFPAGGDGVYMVVDEKGQFREDNFHKALTALQSAAESTNVDTKKMLKRKGKANLGDLEKIVRMCNSAF